MIIKGKYNDAKVFTENIEEQAIEQIQTLCNQEFTKDTKIRIMPDVHAGKGCTIGFAGDLGEFVIPSIIGVDIGCGVLVVKLGNVDIDGEKVDKIIRKNIPSGKNVHMEENHNFDDKLNKIKILNELVDISRIRKSIGSLGGGNHFIEINTDTLGNKYLLIHTGSRNLGNQIAQYYQNIAIKYQKDKKKNERQELIQEYKNNNKENEINSILQEFDMQLLPNDLCYLENEDRENYLNDLLICQEYANFNRETIANNILIELTDKNLDNYEYFHTPHNYIDFRRNIIRKGSISSEENEVVIIPINMRDGALLCKGKSNSDWNYSAPHGAGRLYSRAKAREMFSLDEFEQSMKNIYTNCISKNTIDECPMAYKNIDEIIENIKDTVEIIDIIKPIYNFKTK